MSKSPNVKLDKAVDELLDKVKTGQPIDDSHIKALNTAVAWEKAKNGILDKTEPFDPDSL
jgi:hypothetical protein